MNPISWIFAPSSQRQTLALAGVAQSVCCLQSLAENGHCASLEYERAVLALLARNPETDADVFGKQGELNSGLELLKSFCEGEEKSQKVKYLVQILYLQKRLMKRHSVLRDIAEGLEKSNKQLEFYSADSDSLALSLGELYQNTLSTLGFRIQVIGNPDYLGQDRIAAKVRTLLFSGVRYALLWRQLGGRSRQLLLSKSTIARHCESLIKDYNLPE